MRPRLDRDSPYHLELPGPALDPELQPFLADVPRELRRTLVAAGLEPLLARMRREQARTQAATVELLSMRQELSVRLGSLESQLASVLYEIDCTGDALEALRRGLEDREHERELKLTISSLVLAAATGVFAGAWDARTDESKGAAIVAAAGAGASAALGVAAFVPKHRSLLLMHERNLLTPIVKGEDESHLYPAFVFRLLTLPSESGKPTPRSELLAAWDQSLSRSQPPEARQTRAALLYGRGGLYDQELMRVREAMFDQLESRVTALYRELELLDRYQVNVTATSAAP